jgi:hypothetical protein
VAQWNDSSITWTTAEITVAPVKTHASQLIVSGKDVRTLRPCQ